MDDLKGGEPIFTAKNKNEQLCPEMNVHDINVDFANIKGKIKPIHGVGNGPVTGRFVHDKTEQFKRAKIPYSRLHDTEGSMGSGEFVNIHCIFKNFDADENDPASYNFAATDKYLECILNAGTKIFYRLGETIENNFTHLRSYTFVPKDMHKWARICEHIIRHYNEGWANGYHMNIEYWEIWNEPEGAVGISPNWSGSAEEYFELYRITANHLKSCFPSLKIGGFGCTGFYEVGSEQTHALSFIDKFFKYITSPETKAPIDFSSWHIYTTKPERVKIEIEYSKKVLEKYNLAHIENIIDEWNYMECWAPEEGLTRKSMVGAAFVSAVHTVMQKSTISKSMYYDAEAGRISFCGLFNEYTKKEEKPYYCFIAFGKLYELGYEASVSEDSDGIYALAATDSKSKSAVMAVNYMASDTTCRINLKNVPSSKNITISTIDSDHSLEKIFSVCANAQSVELVLKTNTIAFIDIE